MLHWAINVAGWFFVRGNDAPRRHWSTTCFCSDSNDNDTYNGGIPRHWWLFRRRYWPPLQRQRINCQITIWRLLFFQRAILRDICLPVFDSSDRRCLHYNYGRRRWWLRLVHLCMQDHFHVALEHDRALQKCITHQSTSSSRFRPDLIECADNTKVWADTVARPRYDGVTTCRVRQSTLLGIPRDQDRISVKYTESREASQKAKLHVHTKMTLGLFSMI